MPQIAIQSGPLPVGVEMGSALRLSDDELFELCVQNPELPGFLLDLAPVWEPV